MKNYFIMRATFFDTETSLYEFGFCSLIQFSTIAG